MLKQRLGVKNKLSQTLRSWLPMLQVGLEDLKESLVELSANNPFVSVNESPKTGENGKNYFDYFYKSNANSAAIEARAVSKKNVFDLLDEQLGPPLFPTARSQEIGQKIIECLNEQGYFEFDENILKNYDEAEVERVRARFKYLDPVGVGARDFKEALLFALDNEEGVDEGLYDFIKMLIKDFENVQKYIKDPLYKKALTLLKKFSTPPFLEYFEDSRAVIPDLFILRENDEIRVKLNEDYYPQISLEINENEEQKKEEKEFLNQYIKEAKNLIDALNMRKATLYKIGLMIVEYQYDFFCGKEIKPMTLKHLAGDLERNASTISRAIANKYLSCDRGVIALKDFFSFALDEEVSNASVKEYILSLIKNEDHKKPLSDSKILSLINKEFKLDLGRRTVTKYRQQLQISSSTDRKKLYEIKG